MDEANLILLRIAGFSFGCGVVIYWICTAVSDRTDFREEMAREDKAREERLNAVCADIAQQYHARFYEIGRDEHGDFHAIHHGNHASAFTDNPIDYAAWARELRRRRACIQFNRPRPSRGGDAAQ